VFRKASVLRARQLVADDGVLIVPRQCDESGFANHIDTFHNLARAEVNEGNLIESAITNKQDFAIGRPCQSRRPPNRR
jgi:hypothetical protein